MKKVHYFYKGTVSCGVKPNKATITPNDWRVTCKRCKVQMAIWDRMDMRLVKQGLSDAAQGKVSRIDLNSL